MGCSRYMALGSTCRAATPRTASAARANRTTANACNATWRAHRLPANDEHCTSTLLPFDARSICRDCTRARWAAHATWRSAARVGPPHHGQPVPHEPTARRQTRATRRGYNEHCTSRPRSTLDRSAVTAHERDGLLTLHGARQHVSGRHTTDSQCRTSQPHDGKRVQRDVASAPTASERRALHQHAAPVRRSIDLP